MALKEHAFITNRPTTLDEAIEQTPSLEALGRPILTPLERKDHGVIEYTTVADTIHHWAEDPRGERKLAAIGAMYGIPQNRLTELLSADPGMREYLAAKAEGRFVGMVSTQINKPSLYFMTDALMLAQLHKRGIPVALMMLEYPSDTFASINPDKWSSFGKIEFPVGMKTDGSIETIHFALKPAGHITKDGRIIHVPNMRIEDVNGIPCDRVLVKIDTASDPHGKRYPNREGLEGDRRADGTIVDYDETKAFLKASLGIEFHGDYITLTDFYKLLWNRAIQRLREIGELPSEEDMPMFYVNMSTIYTAMAAEAAPPQETIRELGYDTNESILRDVLRLHEDRRFGEEAVANALAAGEEGVRELLARDNERIENGLLVHANGMMDAGTYYPAQVTWPDLYIECSSCGGEKFVSKLARAQRLRHRFGVPEVEVRLPDTEMPELEAGLVHTGRYVDRHAALGASEEAVAQIGKQIGQIAAEQRAGTVDKDTARRRIALLNDESKALRESSRRELYQRIMAGDPGVFRESQFVETLPAVVIALLKHYLVGVDETIAMIQ